MQKFLPGEINLGQINLNGPYSGTDLPLEPSAGKLSSNVKERMYVFSKNPTHIWKTPFDKTWGVFITYLNYTSRKVMLINSLMYEGNIQISEYEGTYLTLI